MADNIFLQRLKAEQAAKNNPMSAFDVPLNSSSSAAFTQTNAEQAAPAAATSAGHNYYGPSYGAQSFGLSDYFESSKPIEIPGTPDAVNLNNYQTPAPLKGDLSDSRFNPEVGFGTPGFDHSKGGLRDANTRLVSDQGVIANGLAQKPDTTVNEQDSYTGPSSAGNDSEAAQIYAKKAVDAQKQTEKPEPSSHNPLMQSTFGYQTGQAPDQIGSERYVEADPEYVKDREISSSRLKAALDGVTGPARPASGGNRYLGGADGVDTSANIEGSQLNPANFRADIEGIDGNSYVSGADGVNTGAIVQNSRTQADYFRGVSPKTASRENALGVKQEGQDFKYKSAGISTGMEGDPAANVNTSINIPGMKDENDQALIDFNTDWTKHSQPGQFPGLNTNIAM